jgi:hypothetical protein
MEQIKIKTNPAPDDLHLNKMISASSKQKAEKISKSLLNLNAIRFKTNIE